MPNGIFPEWLNANAGRAFPLAEDASRLDLTQTVRLPDSLIVAAQISATVDYMGGSFFVSEVRVAPDTVGVTVGFLPTDGIARDIAIVSIDFATHTQNRTYSFSGDGEDTTVLGSLTIGDLSETMAQIPGVAAFDSSATPFEVSAMFCATPAVKAVQVYNGADLVKSFSKILKLRSGENIRLTYVGNDTIRIDAVLGENVVTADECKNALPVLPCIKTINGVSPDENGNFNLDGGKCISVTVTPGLIELVDECSQSCCGCAEHADLMTGLEALNNQIAALQQQLSSTIAQQSQMISGLMSNIVP